MKCLRHGAGFASGAFIAAALAACMFAEPACAHADQSGAGDTSVYVTMELTGQEGPPRSRDGSAGGADAEDAGGAHPPAGEAAGMLPRTGDDLAPLAFAALLGAGASSLAWVRCARTIG